jgi:acetyl-CoA C-acetyltransferase
MLPTLISGGAIAKGHPIGASGARILVELIHNLGNTHKKIGLVTVCIGGGEAIAMVIEAL